MAISERIKAEALRTIESMKDFHKRYGAESAEELEHRIARVEASMEGCNGLTQEEKIQKTAENMFELTCAQERSYDALRAELWKNRAEYSADIQVVRQELKNGLNSVMKKIEDSGTDCSDSRRTHGTAILRLISDHPMIAMVTFLSVLLMVFVSGHFELLAKLLGK